MDTDRKEQIIRDRPLERSPLVIGIWNIGNYVEIPSFEEVKEDTKKFNEAIRIIHENQDPFQGKTVAQKHGNRFVIQYPPPLPLAPYELDAIYELPFMKAWHPAYDKNGGIPGFETIRFSLISHRGCPGQCSFCSLSMHQGRIVQSRTEESLVREARALTEQKTFRGTISDIGGPTANLYKAHCPLWDDRGACRDRSCLTPTKCRKLKLGYREDMKVYNAIMKLPKVKHLFIESGLRYDLLIDKDAGEYLEHICRHHISGQMKVAPEHSIDHVLKIMNKPSFQSLRTIRWNVLKKRTSALERPSILFITLSAPIPAPHWKTLSSFPFLL